MQRSAIVLELSEILSEVSRYERVSLGEREVEFLGRIATGVNSSYKIFSQLKKMGQPMDYKNVNKRVRRLHELGLVTKTKGESMYNAKFYAMTPAGIFYLMAGGWIIDADKSWINNYRDNIIIKYLLEPYFEEDSIKIHTIHYELGKYLYECCKAILWGSNYIQSFTMLAQGKLPKERIKRTKEILLDSIRHELERQAKTLAFRLISQINIISSVGVSTIIRSNEAVSEDIKAIGLDRPYIDDVTKQDFENIHLILAKDKKFIKFSKNLGREYQQAFTNLVESAK